jgi:hypothetical protein
MFSEKLKKKRIKDPICSFLKKLISPYGFGWAEPGGVGRYCNEQLIRWYNKNGFMGSPTNGHIYAHFAGQDTLYFWADGRKSTPQTLSMIDIDCHERGNPESAEAFADWLSENYLPNLYHEPSTHGSGRHPYFILEKQGYGDVAVARVLDRFDKALKKLLRFFLATHPEHEIENVEIKGTPHVITWAKGERRQIESMKSGDLAKLPRDVLDRFEEFKNTTVLSLDDVSELEEKVEKLVIPEPRKLFKAKGSTLDHPIPKDEVEAMNGPYLDFARSWVEEPLETSSRAKVEAEDVAIGLGIVKCCTKKMNADGTMPTQRIKAIWDKLFENDEVGRAFDYHRWRVVRDLIEVHGGLEMVDRRFYTGFVGTDGQMVSGRAAKWYMAEWLVEKLDQVAYTGYMINESQDQLADLMPDHSQGGLCLVSNEDQGGSLLQQEAEPSFNLSPFEHQGGSLLEQEDEDDEITGFDENWIVAFRRDNPPTIGLIWAGSIESVWREAG